MNAIGYTRLSQQSDASIERQKRHIREYADEHGLELEQIYDDGEGSSGFDTAERTAYQKLREQITAGGPDVVIVNDKRRLARDVDEVMRLIPAVRTNDIELHTFQDGEIDLSDPMKAAIEILQAAAAHKEKKEEIEKSIEAVEERINSGYDHGPPRFGMEYDDEGKYQRPGEDFHLVERVWELREEGKSYPVIEGITGVPSSTAHRVVQNKEWYQNRMPAARRTYGTH